MSERAYLSTRKGLFELCKEGGRWGFGPVHFLGEPVSMTLPDPRDGSLYAALNLGHFGVKLHRRSPGAETWTELPAPAYPPKPADSDDKVDWNNRMIWALEAGHASQPGLLWAGTLPGGLFVSRDHGDSWQLVRSLWDVPQRADWFGGGYDVPGIHSVCPHPQRMGEVLVAVSCGGVWVTPDEGESWTLRGEGLRAAYMPPDLAGNANTQDVHRVARCPAAPEVLWCQHHNGIWRSVDDAASWQPVEPPVSSFGFAVAAHPRQRDTAWFAPARADEQRVPVDGALVVNRTRDGGATFETLREGLPQRDCYDLVYRHGLDVAADGEQLLMGSTTGHLWGSADGGDAWQSVASNLPPIHAVRFG